MGTTLRIAAAAWEVQRPGSMKDWQERLRKECGVAAEAGAKLLVLPEYAAMELTGLLHADVCADLLWSLEGMQQWREEWLETHVAVAREMGVSVLAGSFPWQLEDGSYRNRAWLCGVDGECGFQDKMMMTRFEDEEWEITGSDRLRVFDIPGARVGVLVCYDVEFPILARQLVEAGADVLLVPSCTDTVAGFHRVMLSCRARALEQQCFVVQAPLAGSAAWSPAVDVNTGVPGVFTPVDRGFPDDGVLASGVTHGMWLVADVPVGLHGSVRRDGQVRNFEDWPNQFGHWLVEQK